MDNPLWEYSVATYRESGVAETCLALQDTFGVDVNLLLYAAWLADRHQCLSADHLLALDQRVREWRETVIKPLRALRRELRDYPQAAAVRDKLKALELHAEREQQDLMYTFYEGAAEPVREANPLRDNLTEAVLVARPETSDWEGAIQRLAALLSP